jgi:protein gp37
MGATTEISWTHSTFNPWHGCQRVSPGCEHCYAETFSKRIGLKIWGPQAPRRFFGDSHWAEPLKWNAAAEKAGERRRVFCASMADVLEDRRDLDGWRKKLWELILATQWLDWLLLTKRPENLSRLYPWYSFALPSVWLGVTGENQEQLDARWEHLRQADAVVRFVSHEPALGPIRLPTNAGLHWVITGGESGAGARPYRLEWARSLIAEGERAGVAIFVKQLGAHPVSNGELKLFDRKGSNWAEWPEDLRVRQFPEVRA